MTIRKFARKNEKSGLRRHDLSVSSTCPILLLLLLLPAISPKVDSSTMKLQKYR
jgi:hypothetical protein